MCVYTLKQCILTRRKRDYGVVYMNTIFCSDDKPIESILTPKLS